MMQTRCYTCHTLLHDGPPEFHELSFQQMGVVTGAPAETDLLDPALILQQIPCLAGLSVHGLCTPCLDQVVNLDRRVWEDLEGHAWSQRPTNLRTFRTEFVCTCGVDLGSNDDTAAANRALRLHKHYMLLDS